MASDRSYSAKNSCIMHPSADTWLRIFSSYMAICEHNRSGAFLLHWLEYATNKLPDPHEGWVTVSFRELAEQSLGTASASALCSQADRLESLGLIEKRVGGPPGSRRPSSYRIVIDALQRAVFDSCGFDVSSVHPQNGEPESVLIDVFKGNKGIEDNPPTPLELDRPIDKWAEEQARAHGLKLKINTAKKRQALVEADSSELRVRIEEAFEQIGPTGEDATAAILELVGFGNQRRSSGMSRQPFGASCARNFTPTTTTFTQHDGELQKTPLAAQIRACRNDAGINARADDLLHMPPWKVAVLDALRLRDKSGFRQRLTETFANLADDYRQGVTTDAIVESFFAAEQQRAKQSKGGFDDIREYIASLSA